MQAQVQSVFPRRTKVNLRSVAGRVGVYRTDDGALLGVLNGGPRLDDQDLGHYAVEIRSVRRATTSAAAAPSDASGAPARSAENQDVGANDVSGATQGTSANGTTNGGTVGNTSIVVRVTRQVPERRRATPNDAVDGTQSGDAHPTVVEAALSRLLEEGVELFSEDDLRRLAGDAELQGALGHGSELVQWIGRVVEAKTFDEKRGVVRSLMGAGGGCSELVGRLLMG